MSPLRRSADREGESGTEESWVSEVARKRESLNKGDGVPLAMYDGQSAEYNGLVVFVGSG